jgi:hypothetical protein
MKIFSSESSSHVKLAEFEASSQTVLPSAILQSHENGTGSRDHGPSTGV